jgi:hypothetical protein
VPLSLPVRFSGPGSIHLATQAVVLRFCGAPTCEANAINPTGYNSIKGPSPPQPMPCYGMPDALKRSDLAVDRLIKNRPPVLGSHSCEFEARHRNRSLLKSILVLKVIAVQSFEQQNIGVCCV